MIDKNAWADGRIEQLKALWQMGFSAAAIADHLGEVSRSAIIGKARRLGLPKATVEERIIRLSKAITNGENGCPILGIGAEVLYDGAEKPSSVKMTSRGGQSAFRTAVIERYSACAITGCTTGLALQAAHVVPYSRSRSQDPERGILLRADIHSLFDAGLIAIAPVSYTVLTSRALKEADYRLLSGLRAHFASNKPRDADLAWHVANIFQPG